MTQPIAKIRLARGNVGFYDSLTNIILTKAAPEAIVYSGKNTANIKKAIKEGKVVLKEGSLSSLQSQPVYKREIEAEKPQVKQITKPKTVKQEINKKPEQQVTTQKNTVKKDVDTKKPVSETKSK